MAALKGLWHVLAHQRILFSDKEAACCTHQDVAYFQAMLR
jgi:hypothetical protein